MGGAVFVRTLQLQHDLAGAITVAALATAQAEKPVRQNVAAEKGIANAALTNSGKPLPPTGNEIKGGRLVFWFLKEKTEDTYQPRTVDLLLGL